VAVRELVIPYAPRTAFLPFHKRTERWACIVAHRRAGKTVACINDVVRRALTEGKDQGRYAYVAPFLTQAKAVAWDYLLRYSEPVRRAHNASELWVELLNGARVRVFGADNPDALRGLFFDGLIADEYGDWKPSVWGSVIRPALADRQGWATVIGTPKGHNAFHDVWKLAQKDPSWFALRLRASESGILQKDEIADMMRSMTQDQIEQELECSFEAAIVGAIFGQETRALERDGRLTSVPVDEAVPVYTAWDLGYSDDTAIWWHQVVMGEVHVLKCYAASGKPLEHYLDVIEAQPYRYGGHWLPHDARAKTLASGGRSIQEMVHARLKKTAIVPNLALQDGIQAVRTMFPRVYMDEGCEDGLEALKQYQREYDEDKKTFRDRPRHDWTSHYADAFRMMAIAWREEQPPEAAPKPKFWNEQTLDELWLEPKPKQRI
jgi:phage terminase large subunit